MSKKIHLALVFTVILLLVVGGVAQAQDNDEGDNSVRGSIRGKVLEDRNGDGVCGGTTDPVAVGIPIEFKSSDGQHTLYLQSGDDGSYGLVAAGLGTWTVTVRPPANYVAVSVSSVQVFLGTENRLVTGVDFCVRMLGTPVVPGGPIDPTYPDHPYVGGPPGGTGDPLPPPVLLPESGATNPGSTFSNGLLVTGSIGLLMVLMGAVLIIRNRIFLAEK